MEIQPQDAVETPRRVNYLWIVSILALILLALGAYAAYTLVPSVRDTVRPVRELVGNLSVPQDVAKARFLRTEGGITRVYTPEGGGYVSSEAGESIISEDMRSGAVARILRSDSQGFSVVVGGATVAVSPEGKMGVSLSTDGSHVAYAQARSGPALSTVPAELLPLIGFAPSEWTIVVDSVMGATTTDSFSGILPVFIDEKRIVFVREDGIYIRNIGNGIEQQLIAHAFSRVSGAPLVSPDGTLFAVRDEKQRSIQVYRIDRASGQLEEVSSVAAPGGVVSYSLGNEAVYTLRLVDQKTEVWSQSLAGGTPALVFILPADVAADRMSIGII
jgi:hypothetical protein